MGVPCVVISSNHTQSSIHLSERICARFPSSFEMREKESDESDDIERKMKSYQSCWEMLQSKSKNSPAFDSSTRLQSANIAIFNQYNLLTID